MKIPKSAKTRFQIRREETEGTAAVEIQWPQTEAGEGLVRDGPDLDRMKLNPYCTEERLMSKGDEVYREETLLW